MMWFLSVVLCCVTLIVAECHGWLEDSTYIFDQYWNTDYSTTDLGPWCWWTQWGEWGACNGTCSPHSWRERTRKCEPELCRRCHGNYTTEVEQCVHSTCCEGYPKWEEWSRWSKCYSHCGDTGTQIRSRNCDSCAIIKNVKTGSFKTQKCGPRNVAYVSQSRTCKLEKKLPCCEVWDSWSKWGKWSECSATCGRSMKTRTRTCDKDKDCPSSSGDTYCYKPVDQMTISCKVPCCPKPEQLFWSKWGKWSECSVSCGQGQRTRRRKCKKSRCSDVITCKGKRKDIEKCTMCKKCKDPKYAEWGSWSRCSVSCGKGVMQRTRRYCEVIGKCVKRCEDKHIVDKKRCRNKCN